MTYYTENWSRLDIWYDDVLIIDRSFELKRNRLAVIGEDGKLNIKNFLKRLLILSLYYGANQETKEIQDILRNGRKLSRYILK